MQAHFIMDGWTFEPETSRQPKSSQGFGIILLSPCSECSLLKDMNVFLHEKPSFVLA